MTLLAVILVLLFAVSMAIMLNIRKHILNVGDIAEHELLICQCGIGSLTCLVWYVVDPGWWQHMTPSSPHTILFWGAVILSTLANIVIQYASLRSQALGDTSLVAPIGAMTPGFLVLTALLLGEVPSDYGYIGIVLIVGGAYVHAREGASVWDYVTPLFVWTLLQPLSGLPEKERKMRLALRWAYITAIFGTIGLIGDGLLARHGDVLLGLTVELGVLAVCFVLFSLPKITRRNGADEAFLVRFRRQWVSVVSVGVLFGLAPIFAQTAFRLAQLGYIGSLKRLSIPITVMIAVWIMKEEVNSQRRLVTTFVITAGATLLAFDPTANVMVGSADELLKRITGQ